MSEKKKQLKDYLGLWKYTHGAAYKLYKVEPVPPLSSAIDAELFRITWGDEVATLGKNGRTHVVDAADAFRRIRSKASGGWTLVEPYTGVIPKSAELEVINLYPEKPAKIPKAPAPVKKKFVFTDWLKER